MEDTQIPDQCLQHFDRQETITFQRSRQSLVEMRLLIEGVVGLLAASLAYAAMDGWDSNMMISIAGTMASISGTLLGFIIAALSILASIGDKKLISNMKKTGHFQFLLSNLYWTAVPLFFAMIVALVVLFVPSSWTSWGLILAVGLFSVGAAKLVTSGHRFYLVMERLD